MNLIIASTLKTLQKTNSLLFNLTDEQLSDASVSPYYSSIGSHLRHILDFYDCILDSKDAYVDLTARKRDLDVETKCQSAECYLESVVSRLQSLSTNVNDRIIVLDDLGEGKMEIEYTLASLLAQANSHTIHHYAIISYILDRLDITINDATFGYNPSTPRPKVSLN